MNPPGLLIHSPIVSDMIRGMPRSDDAEKGVISCFLQNPEELLNDAVSNLPAEAFYHAGTRLMFEEMLAFRSQKQEKPLGLVTFSQWLIDRGQMDKIGGPATIAELLNFYPTPAHYPYFTGILKDKLLLRQIIGVLTEGIQKAYEYEETPEECLAAVSEAIMQLENADGDRFRKMPQLVQDAISRYEEAMRLGGKLPGISTGHQKLDNATGGLGKGDLWVISGMTSDGKSAFVEGMAHHSATHKHPTAIYTFEMSDDKTIDRFFCIDSQVNNSQFKRGTFTADDSPKITRSASRLSGLPLYIRDVSGMKLGALLADMRLLRRRYKIELFIVDYGQLVRPDTKGHTRESEVSLMSASLKSAAKSMGAAIIVLAQLNDDGRLRESRAIGYDADIVLAISVPDLEDEDDKKDESRRIIHFGKNRDGERGISIPFKFHGPTFTFTEETEDEPSNLPASNGADKRSRDPSQEQRLL